MRIAVYMGIALALVSLGALSIFKVPVDSEALALRSTEVKRKVGPGLHMRIPFLENVVTEPVLREQQFGYDTVFEIHGCPAAVSVIDRIEDFESYHASGGDLTVLMDMRHAIKMSLDALPDISGSAQLDRPYDQQIAERLRPLTGPAADGLHVNRIHVSLEEGCVPKRVVTETPLPSLAAQQGGAFAPERAAPGNLRMTTFDGVEIRIEGFAATYQIEDTARAATCFSQNRSIVATRVAHLAEATLREVVENLTLDQMAELPTRLHRMLPNNNLGQCGVSLGSVDFNDATFARRSVVNCEEAPTEDCFPQTFLTPGLTLQD